MKKNYIFLFILTFWSLALSAQNVPKGMNYQAVARDLKGNVLKEQPISLQISLKGTKGKIAYAETHHITTSELGLFNIIIGEGEIQSGAFAAIPWSSEEIWMEMAIDEAGGEDFVVLSSSRLLAVPYAFHAGTASEIVNSDSESHEKAAMKGQWQSTGNDGSDPNTHFIGNIDAQDLIIKTNSIERIRILANGGVSFADDLTIGTNLDIGQDLHVGKDLDVDNNANVDMDAHIGQDLDVDRNANVDADLTVGGNASFANALNVGGSTTLAGSLNVSGVTTLSTLNLGGMTSASSDITGNQSVGGNQSVAGNLNVTGKGTLSGLTVSGPGMLQGEHVALFENTNAGNADGIAIKINKANTDRQNNFITFYRGDGGVAGRIEGYDTSNDLAPPLPNAGHILQTICDVMLISDNPMTNAWTNAATGLNTFGNFWNGATIPSLTLPDFPGVPLPNVPAIVIPKIEVFGGIDMPSPVPNIPKIYFPETSIFGGLNIPDVPSLVIPDVPSFDFSAQIGSFPHIPTVNEVCPNSSGGTVLTDYLTSLISWGMTNDFQSMLAFSPKEMAAKAAIWGIMRAARDGGITYGSEGADYAEYLPRQNENEIFVAGDIVGIYGGKISKNTEGADQVLAVSSFPIVLGNTPGKEEDIKKMEKIGFLGQVPVYVQGKANIGDFIIPSGKNNGIGIAVAQDELTLEQMKQVLGKAWSASTDDKGLNLINVSIGVQTNEWAELLSRQQAEMNTIQEKLNRLESLEQRLGQMEAMLGLDGATKENTLRGSKK